MTQGDPLLELVSYPETLQLAFSRRFGELASLRLLLLLLLLFICIAYNYNQGLLIDAFMMLRQTKMSSDLA